MSTPTCFKSYPLFDPPVQNKRLCHQCDHQSKCIELTAPVGAATLARKLEKELPMGYPPTEYTEIFSGAVPESSALDVQVGGGHYKDMAIQPAEFVHRNRIPYLEGSVIYYVSRWRTKNGVEDLRKARHTIDLLIELEEKTPDKSPGRG